MRETFFNSNNLLDSLNYTKSFVDTFSKELSFMHTGFELKGLFFEERQQTIKQLQEEIQNIEKLTSSKSKKFNHLSEQSKEFISRTKTELAGIIQQNQEKKIQFPNELYGLDKQILSAQHQLFRLNQESEILDEVIRSHQ
jgi:archaellum component FlaC